MTDFNYKKYSLEKLEEWMHDAMSAGEATPQEIYDVIKGVVEENYYTYKHQASQAYELLALINGNGKGHITNYPEEVSDDCMPPWGHSDLEYLSKNKQDKVVKWILPVEEVENGDTGEQEYFITFPDDLLEAANLKQGDDVEWVDNNDGSFLLRKIPKSCDKELKDEMEELIDKAEKFYHKASHKVMSYQEATDSGYSITDDGFWIPPEKENDLYVSEEK